MANYNTYLGFLVFFSMIVIYGSLLVDSTSWVAISNLLFTNPIQASANMFGFNKDEVMAFIVKCVFAL